MRWWNRAVIWWRSRSWLAGRVRELEAEIVRLKAAHRADRALWNAEVTALRESRLELLRENQQLETGLNAAVDAAAGLRSEVEREKARGNVLMHRAREARDWARCLDPVKAVELRALLSPHLPTQPAREESPDAAVV
ncbi:hypothetical protein QQG74_09975 [Micromonospora sp. FIMYZ51]|uniref:hypothetical protein n=1 Tax=Micromonospora sp. FIMYZ51 TaxID=3051832 RepID=UPI00311E1204